MLTTKQKLILLLISGEPGFKGIRKLVAIFERFDFPPEMMLNLKPLLDNNLIYVSHNFDNGTPARYQTSKEGEKYLLQNFNDQEILDYLKGPDDHNILYEVTRHYIEKKNQRHGKD